MPKQSAMNCTVLKANPVLNTADVLPSLWVNIIFKGEVIIIHVQQDLFPQKWTVGDTWHKNLKDLIRITIFLLW